MCLGRRLNDSDDANIRRLDSGNYVSQELSNLIRSTVEMAFQPVNSRLDTLIERLDSVISRLNDVHSGLNNIHSQVVQISEMTTQIKNARVCTCRCSRKSSSKSVPSSASTNKVQKKRSKASRRKSPRNGSQK